MRTAARKAKDRLLRARSHLDEVVADALGSGVEGLLRPERGWREVGVVLRVVGDVAGDVRGLLRRRARRRLHLLGRAALDLRHGGHQAGERWGIATISWRVRRRR